MFIHCCILLDFFYELYYDARIYEHQNDSCSAGQNLSIFNGPSVSTAWWAHKIRMQKIAYMHGEYRQIYSAVDN